MAFFDVGAVVFVCQFLDVRAHGCDVSVQRVVFLLFCLRVEVVFECLERHLRVDDNIPVVGEVQDDIGYHSVAVLLVVDGLSVVFHRHLFLKLCALFKAHALQ